YIGRTHDLSIARLEESAQGFADAPTAQTAAAEQATAGLALEQHHKATTLPPLQEARLHPPRLPSELIARPRLFDRLDDWRSYKLTLLHAPAGFGKTTLVNSWLARHDSFPEVAWISLDSSDNDPVRFWRSVLSA